MAACAYSLDCESECGHVLRICLQCQAPHCEAHLRSHFRKPVLKTHRLIPPAVSLEKLWCDVHREPLWFYCDKDKVRVCSHCAIVGDHKDHAVITLDTAKEGIKSTIESNKRRVSEIFSRMRRALDQDEAEVLHREELAGRRMLSRIDNDIENYNDEICNLQEKVKQLQHLENEADTFTFMELHVNLEEQKRTDKSFSSSSIQNIDIGLSWLKGVIKHLTTVALFGCSPTLDENSTNYYLKISSDLKTVHRTPDQQPLPIHLERFNHWDQVLGSEALSLKSDYWEVEVKSSCAYRVGVTYESIPRKGDGNQCQLGHGSGSWCLIKSKDRYYSLHDSFLSPLVVCDSPQRVGILIEYKNGMLSFYAAETMVLLCSFYAKFDKRLKPCLTIGDGSLTIQ